MKNRDQEIFIELCENSEIDETNKLCTNNLLSNNSIDMLVACILTVEYIL